MSTKVKIKYDEIQDIVVGEVPDYPKYTTQILNLANQNSQGTRPKVVGQMSDLIQEFDGRTVEEWIDGYIGYIPVSIKPHTYRSKSSLAEEITVQVIYYEKKKGGITIEFDL